MDQTTWKDVLSVEKEMQYFKDLLGFVEDQRQQGKVIYPQNSEIFSALQHTPFNEVKVVVLGQDPYHGPGQAHGLSFSVRDGVPFPPSLQNIFLELKNDLGVARPASGNLERWAKQGVLLLNAVLSVEAANAGSHANRGWEKFTDKIIAELNEKREGLVFMLWGSYAQKKGEFIDRSRHLVLHSPHPSPLSAHRGFLGCKHFSKANSYLKNNGLSEINW